MSRRVCIRLVALGLIAGLAGVGWAWMRSEAVVDSYHAVALGMPLADAERALGLPRTDVLEDYRDCEDVDLAEDDTRRTPHIPATYQGRGYLVVLNYDYTDPDRPVRRKQLIRVRHDWVRHVRDSLPR